MRFSIITPTYKRAEKLARAVRSVQNQTHRDWELIIVNDSPSDTSYHHFASTINDPRIHYYVNDTNKGVNYSRNRALDKVSVASDWIIFLDDDDYLSPDALATFRELITNNANHSWFITNRALINGTPLTQAPRSDTQYSYIWHYLFLRQLKGDVTHAIETKKILRIRFPIHIKQGEEWFFFYQLGISEKMFYHDHNSTITDGYADSGLNFRKRTYSEQLETLSVLFYEAALRGFAYRSTFLTYLFIRLLRILIRKK